MNCCGREQPGWEEAAQAQKPPWRRCFLGFPSLSAQYPCLHFLQGLSLAVAVVLGFLRGVTNPGRVLPSGVRPEQQVQLSAVKQPGLALQSSMVMPHRQAPPSATMLLGWALLFAAFHLPQALRCEVVLLCQAALSRVVIHPRQVLLSAAVHLSQALLPQGTALPRPGRLPAAARPRPGRLPAAARPSGFLLTVAARPRRFLLTAAVSPRGALPQPLLPLAVHLGQAVLSAALHPGQALPSEAEPTR